MSEQFNIRALGRDDWQAFKEIRLLALKSHPSVYGSTHQAEAALSDQEWIERLENDNSRIFGLFHRDKLIGLNAVFTHRDDPSGRTALMAMWYMRDEYKGQNLFAGLVQAGVDWAQAQEGFDKIRVDHREGNEASRRSNQKLGFQYVGKTAVKWPDGQTADKLMYERTFIR